MIDHVKVLEYIAKLKTDGSENDPAASLIASETKAATAVEAFVQSGFKQAAAFTEYYFSRLHNIIKYQADELLIFRALEMLIRSQQLDETILNEILEELRLLRVAAMKPDGAVATTPAQVQ